MLAGAALGLILTQAQVKCLNMAYNYGSAYELGRTFQAVVLVESSGCVNELGDDGRSVGPAQIQVYTAQLTCGCAVSKRILLQNKARNLSIGARFLAACFARFWPDKPRAILCYNVGIPAASKATASQILKSRYVARVLRAEKMLEQVRVDTQ